MGGSSPRRGARGSRRARGRRRLGISCAPRPCCDECLRSARPPGLKGDEGRRAAGGERGRSQGGGGRRDGVRRGAAPRDARSASPRIQTDRLVTSPGRPSAYRACGGGALETVGGGARRGYDWQLRMRSFHQAHHSPSLAESLVSTSIETCAEKSRSFRVIRMTMPLSQPPTRNPQSGGTAPSPCPLQ